MWCICVFHNTPSDLLSLRMCYKEICGGRGMTDITFLPGTGLCLWDRYNVDCGTCTLYAVQMSWKCLWFFFCFRDTNGLQQPWATPSYGLWSHWTQNSLWRNSLIWPNWRTWDMVCWQHKRSILLILVNRTWTDFVTLDDTWSLERTMNSKGGSWKQNFSNFFFLEI